MASGTFGIAHAVLLAAWTTAYTEDGQSAYYVKWSYQKKLLPRLMNDFEINITILQPHWWLFVLLVVTTAATAAYLWRNSRDLSQVATVALILRMLVVAYFSLALVGGIDAISGNQYMSHTFTSEFQIGWFHVGIFDPWRTAIQNATIGLLVLVPTMLAMYFVHTGEDAAGAGTPDSVEAPRAKAQEVGSVRVLSFGILGLAVFVISAAVTTITEKQVQTSARATYMDMLIDRALDDKDHWKVRLPDKGTANRVVDFDDHRLGRQIVTIELNITSKECGTDKPCQFSFSEPPTCTVKVPLSFGEEGFSKFDRGCFALSGAGKSVARDAFPLLGLSPPGETSEETLARLETLVNTRKYKIPLIDTEVNRETFVWLPCLLAIALATALRHELEFPLAHGDRVFFLLLTRKKLELGFGVLWIGLTCLSPLACAGASLATMASVANDYSNANFGKTFLAMGILLFVPIALVLGRDLVVTILSIRQRWARAEVIERWDII